MLPCMKETKCDECICLSERNCKFTKIKPKYYFSSIPSKVMNKSLYGQMEIETENSLKLFCILFHFASFEFIALLRFSLVDTKKTNRNLYSCKRKKVLKVHCS